jgi:hypothetical protein
MSRKYLTILPAVAMIILLAGLPYAQAAPTSQPLNLNLVGAVLSGGNELYTQSGGSVVVGPLPESPSGPGAQPTASQSQFGGVNIASASSWSDNVVVTVSGFNVNGYATFSFAGTLANGKSLTLNGVVTITGFSSAPFAQEYLPVNCGTAGNPACTSVIPGFYTGSAAIRVTETGTLSYTMNLNDMVLESAFLNPGGNTIVIGGANNEFAIVSTYTHAVINWSNVQVGGTLSGSVGSNPNVAGSFSEVTAAREDLVALTETEIGTMSFSGMTPSYLNANGAYVGTSTIPLPGIDFSFFVESGIFAGATYFPSTVTITSFLSTGQFLMSGSPGVITGSYSLVWGIPSVTFGGPGTPATATGTYTP